MRQNTVADRMVRRWENTDDWRTMLMSFCCCFFLFFRFNLINIGFQSRWFVISWGRECGRHLPASLQGTALRANNWESRARRGCAALARKSDKVIIIIIGNNQSKWVRKYAISSERNRLFFVFVFWRLVRSQPARARAQTYRNNERHICDYFKREVERYYGKYTILLVPSWTILERKRN